MSLATVLKVIDRKDIPKCDNIELLTVGGWSCVVKKDEYKIGDLVIYIGVDSIVDFDDEDFCFLKGKFNRIKTIKIRNVISQGLVMPITILLKRNINLDDIKEGMDITEILNIKKYIHPDEIYLYSNNCSDDMKDEYKNIKLSFPEYVPKTDEIRLQNNIYNLTNIKNRNIIISRKEDGCSCTFIFKDGIFLICSRNLIIIPNPTSPKHYYNVMLSYNLKEKMEKYNINIAIQGEIIGPGINGNRHNEKILKFKVFNIWDIEKQQYYNHTDLINVCNELELETVPIIFNGNESELNLDLDKIINIADNIKLENNNYAEGIVIKTDDNYNENNNIYSRISFKVLNRNYLLKHDL